MIASLANNVLKVTCDNDKELKEFKQWLNYNTRQYSHNDNSGLVIGIDLDAIKLIEPKPSKPAYRVYKHKSDNTTCTVDRNIKGKTDHNLPSDCEWISDWIEYDPPKKWPTPLVERIADIDIKAAEWIVDHWDDLLKNNRYTDYGAYSRDSITLQEMFHWPGTKQGQEYWEGISIKLGE